MENPFRDPSERTFPRANQDAGLLKILAEIATAVAALPPDPKYPDVHPRALIVGGFVRDALLGLQAKDADLEVFGVSPERLEEMLTQKYPGKVITVGRSFGILKVHALEGHDIDISIPRRESKTGPGHKGFTVEGDPGMTVEEAARRRDFTVNAMSVDPLTDEVVDPMDGRADLEARRLRVVDAATFQDDPLRVYRALQFVARLGFTVDDATFALMRDMVARGDLDELSKERITDEVKKLLLRAIRPSRGFELARELGIIAKQYPELQACIETPQEPEWHPEGDVWTHTLMVLDRAAEIVRQHGRDFDENETLQVMVGALCHDLGKPQTTLHMEGRIRSRGHEEAGREPARTLCGRWTFSHDVTEAAIAVAAEHLKPTMLLIALEKGEMTEAQYQNAVRKIIVRIQPVSWRVLLAAAEADFRGRGVPDADHGPYRTGDAFVRAVKALDLESQTPKPLLRGEDLRVLGVPPGTEMGKWIRNVEAARDRGEITTRDEALAFVKRHLG